MTGLVVTEEADCRLWKVCICFLGNWCSHDWVLVRNSSHLLTFFKDKSVWLIVCMQERSETSETRDIGTPKAEITEGCELSDMSAGYQTQTLCRSKMHIKLLCHFSGPLISFLMELCQLSQRNWESGTACLYTTVSLSIVQNPNYFLCIWAIGTCLVLSQVKSFQRYFM